MADNVDITPGVGKTVAADEIAGALHQRIKVTIGNDGTNDGDVSATNPLPVVVSSGTTSITGTVAITGSTSVINTVTVTGSTSVINVVEVDATGQGDVPITLDSEIVTITGSTFVINTVTITGSTSVINTVAITGSTTIIGTATITGSTSVINEVVVTGTTVAINPLQDGRFQGAITTTDCTTAITVVAAVADKTSYISAYMISANVAGGYWLEDGAANALTPIHSFAENGGVSFLMPIGMPIATAITNTTIALKSTVAGSCGCLVLGYAQ